MPSTSIGSSDHPMGAGIEARRTGTHKKVHGERGYSIPVQLSGALNSTRISDSYAEDAQRPLTATKVSLPCGLFRRST
jgi:hypothetical protein